MSVINLLSLKFLLLMSCYIHHAPVQAQFLPPPPCTAATPPPPELRPLDSDANLLSGCSLPEERAQKSAISETTAHRLALCNSFCTNRVFSGDYVLTNTQKQSFPGYPVWLIATQSYLLSDDGTSTDCILGDNQNGCSGYPGCQRFTPISFDIFNPIPGGYKQALDCKLGCMLQFETPSLSVTSCRDSCKTNCESVACQCQLSPFGGGCEPSAVGPCGRFCIADSCEEGCSDADLRINSNNITTYPSAANPTQAPVVTQIGNGTRYMLNITDSIPSGLSSDLGLSTLIVRVLDNSSTTKNDYTYYILENGFEFDLAPFICREIEVSFAVATHEMSVSDYSPSASLQLGVSFGVTHPGQLDDFNITVEQDNRAGFLLHHIIHLKWDSPEGVELATGYTVSLVSENNPSLCSSATFSLADRSLTSYTIKSDVANQPPISQCSYIIEIVVNPRGAGEVAQKRTGILVYNSPTSDNVNSSCSSVVDRDSVSYDITFTAHFDETFTPAVISAIQNLRISSFEINSRGNAVAGTVRSRIMALGSNVTQGPFTFDVLFNDLPQTTDGHGYTLSVAVSYTSSLPVQSIFASCDIYDVGPIPPDPVTGLSITFMQVVPDANASLVGQISRVVVTLRYSWTAPAFHGEGITGYQVWLARQPATDNQLTEGLHLIGPDATDDELQATFSASDANFTLYFQIRPVSANTQGKWSPPMDFNVKDIPPSPLNIDITCSPVLNLTTRSYDIIVILYLDATFSPSEVAAVQSVRTTAIEVDGNGNAVISNIKQSTFPFEGIERGPANLSLTIQDKQPLTNAQGYYSVQLQLVSSPPFPSAVGSSCEVRSVGPIPPYPVTEIQLLSTSRNFSQDGRTVAVTASFNWTAPEFSGEDIVGYQVWLDRRPAPDNVTRSITHGPRERFAEIEVSFDVDDEDFYIILQIRAFGATTTGNWSQADNRIIHIRATCPQGTYRVTMITQGECLPCPPNTNKTQFNTTICQCLPGFFRTKLEGAEVACTSPPSACLNIKTAFVGNQSFVVEWERPTVVGRADYHYILDYSDGENVESLQVVNQSQVVSNLITGLKPVTEYTVTVTTVNGVSDQDEENQRNRQCQLQITTLEGVPSDPTSVVSYENVIVWDEPLSPNGDIVAYEIQFLIPGTQFEISRFRNERGTYYAVQDDDQLSGDPSILYFRVRAATRAGVGRWSLEVPLRSDSMETTAPLPTSQPVTCPVCTCPQCPPTLPPCTCGTDTPTTSQSPQPIGDIHFFLKGQPLTNNSVIAITDVGELEDALMCRTNLTNCCGTPPNRFGQFYYPNGAVVPINSRRDGYYRNRGFKEVRLNRRSGVDSPTGTFRCEIPDSNMILQNVYITLV